jgi:hypothetical protein
MPIFACDKCGVVDNTALTNYWTRKDGPALCSECDPIINQWHGAFDRIKAVEVGYWVGYDGFLYSPAHPPKHTKLVGRVQP